MLISSLRCGFIRCGFIRCIESRTLGDGSHYVRIPQLRRRYSHIVYTDGACQNNPGVGGAGALLMRREFTKDSREEIEVPEAKAKVFVGEQTTNNICEYHGILLGLQLAKQQGVRALLVRTDSQLITNQLNGVYRVKSVGLKELYDQVQVHRKDFTWIKIEHIYRRFNAQADALANEAITDRLMR